VKLKRFRNSMGEQGQRQASWRGILPPWVNDPDVLSFLKSENIELTVILDEKYLRGDCDRPLVILRGIELSSESSTTRMNILRDWELL
jgi:hypothetical protein